MASQEKRDMSRSEDYLVMIYNLHQQKGYTSTLDLSERLGVKPPTVSSMVAKLARDGYLVHEPYRGMRLTPSGTTVARSIIRRHETVEAFLIMLGIDKDVAHTDSEGLEHHLHPVTLRKLEQLVEFFRNNPDILRAIRNAVDETHP